MTLKISWDINLVHLTSKITQVIDPRTVQQLKKVYGYCQKPQSTTEIFHSDSHAQPVYEGYKGSLHLYTQLLRLQQC